MEAELANSLADTVITQFQEMPLAVERMNINRDRLVQILSTIPIKNSPGRRMQLRLKRGKKQVLHDYDEEVDVPGKEADNALEKDAAPISQAIYPRRIVTNFETNYKKKLLERAVQSAENWLYGHRIKAFRTFDATTICSELRDNAQISAIRKRCFEAGNPYLLMVKFYTALDIAGEHGGYEKVDIPLFFEPGATKEDLDVLAAFSMLQQSPKHEAIADYIKHGVFTEKVYGIYAEMLKQRQEMQKKAAKK